MQNTQTKTNSTAGLLVEGFMSIYDFSPSIASPYKNNDNQKAIGQHWLAVGGYLQRAMGDFDNEQKSS